MKSSIFLYSILLLSIWPENSLADCPNEDDFAPCTCDGEGLNCRLALDNLEIQQAFKTYSSTPSARALFVQGTPVTKLTKGIFGRYAIREFYLDLNQIETIESGTFDNSLNLTTTISLYKNRLQSFPYQDVRRFTNLQILNLAANLITSVPDGAFGKSPSLERLILMFNKITHIGKGAFDGLTNLKALELSANALSVLGPESFSIPNHHSELAIDLGGNRVTSVSPTAFLKTAPKTLLLNDNNMTTFLETNYKALVNYMSLVTGFISVQDNPFTCSGCDYRWLVGNTRAHDVLAGFVCTNGRKLEQLTSASIKC